MKEYFLSVIHGRRNGFSSLPAAALLRAGSFVYGALHGLHRMVFEMGFARRVMLPVPVLSVGNITAGGTGKTPLAESIARRLGRRGLRVAILARGYGRRIGGGDDEEAEAGLTRVADPNRAMGGRRAIEEHQAQALVLDDGFQHYRLHRDLDVVAVDATQPFGYERLLPRGLLRDRPTALRRAGLIVITRTDQVTPAELAQLRDRLSACSLGRPMIDAVHRPVAVRFPGVNRSIGLEWLRERRVYAFCGLGNPHAFKRTLEQAGAGLVKFRAFPDHHPYDADDARRIEAEAQEFLADALVTTAKDATKLDPSAFKLPLATLRVELEITRGDDILESLLDGFVRERAAAPAAR